MSSAVGDQSELRLRKAEAVRSKEKAQEVYSAREDDGLTMDPVEKEYVEYFRAKYGDNPRTDFLGMDGVALFCVIYVIVAGVVLSILYFSVYARHRNLFSNALGHVIEGAGGNSSNLGTYSSYGS
mmetsp:Transcript_51717/g.147422  ORF Transcript_51717/g.147422 Transcript_51717/m.147422 type:complete len:125 (+) Transcript_51717:85-459(+)